MSSSPARRLAWLLVGALIGLSLLMWLPRGPRAASTAEIAPTSRPDDRAVPAGVSTLPDQQALTSALAPRTKLPMNRANRAIQLGLDLHALADELLPTAEGGDAEARYSLSQIIETCGYELTRYADEAALAARREELLERAAGIHGHAAVALDEERYRMCDGFRRDPLARFGERAEWLQRAVEAGHPLASVTQAIELDRGPAPGEPLLTDAERLARQRELFLVGLESGRPEALWEGFVFEAGDAPTQTSWSPAPEGVAWLLLACARGLECSRNARWRREWEMLAGMPPYDDWSEALLFDLPPYQRETALARARELAAALDRGDAESILPATLQAPLP